MELEIADYKGSIVVCLTGEIDMYSSPVLREKLLGVIGKRPQMEGEAAGSDREETPDADSQLQ
jgi:hypothetical protein